MPTMDDFAVFILTHGRADNVKTHHVLRRSGYTGDIFLLIDDEDEQGDMYRERYGAESVIEFCKREVAERVDAADNFHNRKAILYARHAVFDVARELGLKRFLMLDDDVYDIQYRTVVDESLPQFRVRSADRLFEAMLELLEATDADTVAFAQGGDLIGGAGSTQGARGCSRKAMNSFFCRTDRPLPFVGTMNEDVCQYVRAGMTGRLCLTVARANICMSPSQLNAGGMSAEYLDAGTYVKTFYSIMTDPSCVRIGTIVDYSRGNPQPRIHHKVLTRNAYAKIIEERWRK